MSQPARQAQKEPTAAKAVQHVCSLLQTLGVGHLAPEIMRQAKFDAPTSRQPLLQALLELAVLVLAEFPPGAADGLQRFKQQLSMDAVEDENDNVASSAKVLLLHCLSQWGCPQGLVAQLALPQPSSRTALLALCWMISHAQLFDRALQELQVPLRLLPLLPPYPQDTSLAPHVQDAFKAAAAASQQHQHRVSQLLQDQAASAGPGHNNCSSSSSSGGSWQAVQTAAHHLLSTYRAATLRLQQLTCLLEARDELLHDIWHMQQGQQQQHPSATAAGSAPGTVDGPQYSSRSRVAPQSNQGAALTAFELYLLAHPAVLDQHQAALQEAILLLQQQQELKQAARVFFAWATSAVAEAQQQWEAEGAAAPSSSSSSKGSSSSSSSCAGMSGVSRRHSSARVAVGRPFDQTHQAPDTQQLLTPTVDELQPLVQQLPPAGSQLRAGVLSKVVQQLRQAAAASGVVLHDMPGAAAAAVHAGDALGHMSVVGSGSQTVQPVCSGQAEPTGVEAAAAQLQGLSTRQVAAAMIETGVPCGRERRLPPLPHSSSSSAAKLTQRAAQAMVQAGISPAVQVPELQQLPEDLQQVLQEQQAQQQERARQQQIAAQALQQAQRCCSLQRQVRGQVPQQDIARQQQQQQQLVQRPVQRTHTSLQTGLATHHALDAAAGAVCVAATDECRRLSSLALQVAQQLAHTRATNKRQLAAAAELLLAAGSGTEGGKLVLYQS